MRWILTAFLALYATSAPGADWPQWLGPQRDGVWREDGLLERFPEGGPRKLWSTPVGQGYAGPAVAAGKVFVTDRVEPSGGAEEVERVHCFDAASGKSLWSHSYPCRYDISYPAGPRATPTVDGDRVYTLGAMGDLLCLDTASGRVLWSKNLPKDFAAQTPVWGFACHPLVDGDKLIVVGGGPGKLVLALNKLTGAEIWGSQECPVDFGYCPPMIYEFGGRRQLIVWHAQAVVGLDPESGERLWSVPWEIRAALTAPTPRKVGDSQLFLTTFYHGSMLLEVKADGASIVWKSQATGERPTQTKDLSSIISTPFVDGGTVYGVDSYGELRGLEAATGKRLWMTMKATRGALTDPEVAKTDAPDRQTERWGNAFLIRQGDRFWLFNEQGDLIIARLTPSGYEELSRAHLIEPTNKLAGRSVLWMHPALANRSIYLRNDRELVAYSLEPQQ